MANSKFGVYLIGAILSAVGAFAMVQFLKNDDQVQVDEPGSAPQSFLARGQVKAIGDAQGVAKQIRTVYVILKDAAGGPPYAVARLSNPGLSEVPFELTNEHIMIPGRPAPQSPVLKIRFDADADAGTENVGDVVGELSDFVVGQDQLEVAAHLKTVQ